MHVLRNQVWFVPVSALVLGAFGCGDDETSGPEGTCSVADQSGCAAGLVCEEVQGAAAQCFSPVSFKGTVYNALDKKGIPGAHVVARDANGAAVSRVAITGPDGTYAL